MAGFERFVELGWAAEPVLAPVDEGGEDLAAAGFDEEGVEGVGEEEAAVVRGECVLYGVGVGHGVVEVGDPGFGGGFDGGDGVVCGGVEVRGLVDSAAVLARLLPAAWLCVDGMRLRGRCWCSLMIV